MAVHHLQITKCGYGTGTNNISAATEPQRELSLQESAKRDAHVGNFTLDKRRYCQRSVIDNQ